jgi:hypothetical protein
LFEGDRGFDRGDLDNPALEKLLGNPGATSQFLYGIPASLWRNLG